MTTSLPRPVATTNRRAQSMGLSLEASVASKLAPTAISASHKAALPESAAACRTEPPSGAVQATARYFARGQSAERM